MMISRLWLKSIGFIFCVVGLSSLAIILAVIPMSRNIAYQLVENYAMAVLDQVYDLVDAKHIEREGFRNYALKAHKRELKNITEIVERYLEIQLEKNPRPAGNDTDRQKGVQARTLEDLRRFRYADDDYVWVSDYNSVLISHPDPALHNQDFSEVRDVYGNFIVPPMVAVALDAGEGFTSYWWNRLGRTAPVEKLTYSKHFEPWQWVYGIGVYIDDIEEEAENLYQNMIDLLRGKLSSISIARTGYMYIFDQDLNMIVHPTEWLEGTNFSAALNPMSGQPIGLELMEAARNEAYLLYLWDRPDDPGNFAYEKISWVRFHPEFKWYIASSIYTEDLYLEAELLTRQILIVSVAVFFVALVIGALFMRRITNPVQQLSKVALAVRQGNYSQRSRIERKDEIGVLSQEFDAMIDALEHHLETLDSRVKEKTAAINQQMSSMEATNREIAESIQYARSIQSTILPGDDTTPPWVNDRFVIWKPKDIIGGDIFWLRTDADGFQLAVIDCTGHGVPGAVMTMIAAMTLDRAIKQAGTGNPATVLNDLDQKVRQVLNQHVPEGKTDDGLDIALCHVEPAQRRIRFAGARLSIFVVQDGVAREYRGDRQSIGYRSGGKITAFQTHDIEIQNNQYFYLATDGFTSQVGGPKSLPFGKRRFIKLLETIYPLDFSAQKAKLQEAIKNYMRDQDQRDDITVLAFSLKPGEESDKKGVACE